MKYPQLVQMPRDVEDWLEEQLEARGIDAVVYARYINFWKDQDEVCHGFENWPPCNSESLKRLAVVRCLMSASDEKYDIEELVDELCAKLKEIENKRASHFEFVPPRLMADSAPMDPELNYYTAFPPLINADRMMSNQPTLPIGSSWTRGLLHDSIMDNSKNHMEDDISALFYGNPSEDFGFNFIRNKSENRQDGDESDRINFYNKQNLLVSQESERLYERNPDMDKLIAKFDANIEDLWNPNSKSNEYYNFKCQNLMSNIHYGSNFIWSFKNNEDPNKEVCEKAEKEKENVYKSTFSNWNKFSPPVLPSSGIGNMLSAVNVTFSNMKWSAVDGQENGSNALLNHRKEDSCFTEVVPKTNPPENEKTTNSVYMVEPSHVIPEEEDLLTSTKTHFRPIRMEELQNNQTTVYADGTTFAISNELEKVSFKRSESGTLYLDADAELEAPRKYMEFKEKEGLKSQDSESDLSSMEEFIPKFRVRQSNEKCCQTEEIDEDQMVPSLNESDEDSDSYTSEADVFYFPGDDELAQNIINSLEEETKIETGKIQSDCNYNDIYVPDNEKMECLEISSFKMPETNNQCNCANSKGWNAEWDRKPKSKQEWSEIWSPQNPCGSCKSSSEKISSKDQYCRFREELTQDGEQLLSDLSCLQQLYSNSDWCDDDSTTASDFNDDEIPNPTEEVIPKDAFFSSEMIDNYNNLNKDPSWRSLWSDDAPKDNFQLTGLWSEEKLVSDVIQDDEKDNEINERTFITDVVQKERTRRNSSSQKACSLYLEGQCRRPHCRFAHHDSAIPCPFFADASCLKGESCPLSHGLRRPLSLTGRYI